MNLAMEMITHQTLQNRMKQRQRRKDDGQDCIFTALLNNMYHPLFKSLTSCQCLEDGLGIESLDAFICSSSQCGHIGKKKSSSAFHPKFFNLLNYFNLLNNTEERWPSLLFKEGQRQVLTF